MLEGEPGDAAPREPLREACRHVEPRAGEAETDLAAVHAATVSADPDTPVTQATAACKFTRGELKRWHLLEAAGESYLDDHEAVRAGEGNE